MKRIFSKGGRSAAILLLFLAVWETITRLVNIPNWLLPAPSAIVKTGVKVFPDFLPHFIATVKLSLTGYLIGCGFGFLAAVCLHLLPKLKEAVYPFLILSQNIPIIVLAPLLVIWFGFGILPKIIIITLFCFFPVAVAALDGFRQVPHELRYYMEMAGATKSQLFLKLELPGSLPSIFSGLKISAAYSVMGAVVSEWIGAQEGIGVFMTIASSSFQTEKVFVAIFVIMALSLLFFLAIVLLEKRLMKWQAKGDDKR
ncbi:ABC transporter permease [Bacillus smithii]|uniref:ABC transporter permease n=1 Tax=Bacillus smithii TaxID=1479 RepID=UPI003D244DA2